MSRPVPRLELFGERIAENARAVVALAGGHGARVWGVGKVCLAHPVVVDALLDAGCYGYADSRIENLARAKAHRPDARTLLLRAPAPSRAAEAAAAADVSLNSSLVTMRLLSDAALALGRRHQVIVMVDVGDLREGVWPDRLGEVVASAAQLPGLEVVGIGTNLACYGGVAPSVANMGRLVAAREAARSASGLELPWISGGNSSALPLLASGAMPTEVNDFRMGESIILGRNVLDRTPWPGTRQDTVRVVAEVIEVEAKPSLPITDGGERGQDAFGGTTEFVDRGVRRRAICALGRQDTVIDGLEPCDERIIILGGSSDHLLLDVHDAREVQVGDEIAFWPGYGALLAASTSEFVAKVDLRVEHVHGLASRREGANSAP